MRSILVVVALTLIFTGVTLGVLVTVFGLRVELAGNNLRPIFSFADSDEHFADLEENRSQHYSHLLPAAPISVADAVAEPYWTDFRGPRRDGRYTQTAIRTDWTSNRPVPVWYQPIGGGYASFAIADNRAR